LSFLPIHLLDLGGDISGNGLSKLFLTLAAAFAEAERDRIRERVSQVKADQKARGRYLGGIMPFGYRRGENGELVAHEVEQDAIREMAALKAQGRPLRAIRDLNISHEGVGSRSAGGSGRVSHALRRLAHPVRHPRTALATKSASRLHSPVRANAHRSPAAGSGWLHEVSATISGFLPASWASALTSGAAAARTSPIGSRQSPRRFAASR
jgi:hypothetical protein